MVTRETDALTEPREPGIAFDDVRDQRAGERLRCALEREEHTGRGGARDRPTTCVDELDEPVGGVERELHESKRYRTYVRTAIFCGEAVAYETQRGRPRAASSRNLLGAGATRP